MLHEELRFIHEDIERLEKAIADRILDDPKNIRQKLTRDHEIASFLDRIHSQSQRALQIYNEQKDERIREIQAIRASTSPSASDAFADFNEKLDTIKAHHQRYPNEPVENLEKTYKKVENGGSFVRDLDGMFTGEESFGRFFDLTMLHEEYLNLPGVKGHKKMTYLSYLNDFDAFTPPKCTLSKRDKMTDEYFSYVGSLAQYLESFMRRTRPLENLEKLFRSFDDDFEKAWADDEVEGWEKQQQKAVNGSGPATEGSGEGVWCADCEKEFKNDNVYKAHLTGKKHIKNAEARQLRGSATNGIGPEPGNGSTSSAERAQEKAVAEREYRVRKLAAAMSTEREDTRVNVERKAGMTDRERQQELAELYADEQMQPVADTEDAEEDDNDESKIANPLKLPLAWDGKPIPFWLYRLHGLGVEFPCEICGNFVYMGRRAFEKHFSEARHIYGLKCLGITNTGLFREITRIDEAERLWEKIQRDRSQTKEKGEGVVEMEDSQGNVMPKKVYDDLSKQGLL